MDVAQSCFTESEIQRVELKHLCVCLFSLLVPTVMTINVFLHRAKTKLCACDAETEVARSSALASRRTVDSG